MLEYKMVGYIKSISCFQVNKNVCLFRLKGVLNPSTKTEMHDQNQHTTLSEELWTQKQGKKPGLLGQKKKKRLWDAGCEQSCEAQKG